MIRIKCAGRNNFNLKNIYKLCYFRTYFGLVTIEADVLFTAVHLLPKGIDEHIFVDGSDDPPQARHEAVLGQREVSQLRIHSPKEDKVPCGDM